MNAKRMWIALIVMAAVLALGVTAVFAQAGAGTGGMGNGNGFGNGAADAPNGACCGGETRQGNTFAGWRNTETPRGMTNGFAGEMGLHLPDAVVDELPQAIVDLMIDGWLDEQHAYAVYDAVINQFGSIRPFVNIQRSEAQHITAWEFLFERYNIAVPTVPEFDLPTFNTLTDACAVGIEAETANADLYNTMLSAFEPYPDVLHVAQSLFDASEYNHLVAFQRCVR